MNDIERKYVPRLADLIEEARAEATNKEMLDAMEVVTKHLDCLCDKLQAILEADIERYDKKGKLSHLLDSLQYCGESFRQHVKGISTKLKKYEQAYRDSHLHPYDHVGKQLTMALTTIMYERQQEWAADCDEDCIK